ncbi:hypothetical protein [Candidatus Chloroploca sp. Khr17]|uniref:hypothetical protein n=1 Tax=Candidatus Chloroploca sp. Khr17 TaxID=2496869 RepID=UPI00101BCC6E|nr:hypothetical protein [Candidatus Chloroploca sp. Khr17]
MSQELQDKSAEFAREDMQPEYHFDYTQAKPNRFAQPQADGSLVVVLEPDIAQVFSTPEAVKRVLRALIATMPPTVEPSKGKSE